MLIVVAGAVLSRSIRQPLDLATEHAPV